MLPSYNQVSIIKIDHVTDGKTNYQSGEVTCPGSDGRLVADPGLEPRLLDSETSALSTEPQFLSTFAYEKHPKIPSMQLKDRN